TWTTTLAAGTYNVAVTWPAFPNRATNAPYTVLDGTRVLTAALINQQTAPGDFTDGGVGWKILGTFTVSSGTLTVRLADKVDGYVIADAVRVEAVGSPPAVPAALVSDGTT